jgi:L-amino acid N-acyltransferase YncA
VSQASRDHTVRDATQDDAAAIAAIYAHYVRTSPATFEETVPDAQEIARRIEAVRAARLPWRLAVNASGDLLGYAYASAYRTRSAYRYTLENSVYVAPARVGLGIGSALMRDLIERCAGLGYRQMLAVIGDSANAASIGLHARLGFTMIGTHPAVGYKFGRWIDVVHMQLALGAGDTSAPATLG